MRIFTGVSSLVVNAFQGCTALQTIYLPNPVTTILGYTFRDCTSLQAVIGGTSLSSVASYSFANSHDGAALYCPVGFTTFSSNWTGASLNFVVIMVSDTVVAGIPPQTARITAVYVPDDSVDAYKSAWAALSSKIHPMSEWEG